MKNSLPTYYIFINFFSLYELLLPFNKGGHASYRF